MKVMKVVAIKTIPRERKKPILAVCVESDSSQETSNEIFNAPIPAKLTAIPLIHAAYDEKKCSWQYESNAVSSDSTSTMLQGGRYIESVEGILAKNRKGGLEKVTNATVRIIGLRELWESDSDCTKYFTCEIRCKVWEKKTETLEIREDEFKNIYQCLRKKFPEIYVVGQSGNAIEEYLSSVFKNVSSDLPIIRESELSGWICWDGKTQYVMGKDAFYKGYSIPNVYPVSRLQDFKAGVQFLSVGNGNPQICTLFVAAHLAYLLYWLKRRGLTFQSTFFVRGGTNLLKTAVTRVISNVFNPDRERAVIRLNSTSASMQRTVTYLRDTVVCVDDFSNTESASKKQAIKAAEELIRAVGDGAFPSKCDVTDLSKTTHNLVRSVVIMTGEEGLTLGLSSNLRLIVIPVEKGTFNGKQLRPFQAHPEILQNYFAQFIAFLTEYGESLSETFYADFVEYRTQCAELFEVPRIVDSAAVLRLASEVIGRYSQWCGMETGQAVALSLNLIQNVFKILQISQKSAKAEQPEVLFLRALWDSFDVNKAARLAQDEDVYCQAESEYLGFWESDTQTVWIRPNDAYAVVCNYYATEHRAWLVGLSRLKEILLEKRFSKGKQTQNRKEFLCRAKKGTRKRMLVLFVNEVEKVLNGNSEGI